MEKPPNPERKVEKGEVIAAIRERGLGDPQVRELVSEWTLQQEERIHGAGLKGENVVQARIIFDIDRADLYVAAGDREGALAALEDARLQAHQENEMELYAEIMQKMDELESFLR
ncbi:MAG: hypothetical protein AAB691_00600 [Patescibacteria group bacterium]